MLIQLLEFVQNHWVLSLALLVILALIVFEETKSKFSSIRELSPQDCILLINRERGVIIDLRVNNIFRTSHIIGAINIPEGELTNKVNKLKSYGEKTIVLVGEHNMDMSSVGRKLKGMGISKVCFLSKGMAAWKEAQLPTVNH